MQHWGLRLLVAVLLTIIGYKAPTIWLSISATIWVGYVALVMTLPLLIAASQNTSLAKIANRTLAVLGNIAAAALISAPIVMLRWYWVASFNNR